MCSRYYVLIMPPVYHLFVYLFYLQDQFLSCMLKGLAFIRIHEHSTHPYTVTSLIKLLHI